MIFGGSGSKVPTTDSRDAEEKLDPPEDGDDVEDDEEEEEEEAEEDEVTAERNRLRKEKLLRIKEELSSCFGADATAPRTARCSRPSSSR